MTYHSDQDPIKAFRIGWPLADGELHFLRGNPCVATCSDSGNRDSLPIEFFSHQLLDLDTSSDEALLEFVTEYGIPRHPTRLFPVCGTHYRGSFADSDEQHARLTEAKEISDEAMFGLGGIVLSESEDKWTDDFGEEHITVTRLMKDFWFGTSLEEVRFTLFDLQHEVKEMFDCLLGKIDSWRGNCINAGASNIYAVHTGFRQYPDYSLTQGICNQIIETIADDIPWRACSCEGCDRLYKRQQPRGGYLTKTAKNPSRSKYCSIKCQNRQGQRNRRSAAKNRIKH